MVMRNYGPTWADRTSRYGKTASYPVKAEILLEERAKALRIRAATRTAWVPRRLVTTDRAAGTVWLPMWLANQKKLN